MDRTFKDPFLDRWSRYFERAALPITFYYAVVSSHARPHVARPWLSPATRNPIPGPR